MNFADATAFTVVGPAAEGRRWVGREAIHDAPYPINEAQIGYFCALVEDANENYWDRRACERRFGTLVSPPAMLMVWAFPTPWHPSGPPEHGPLLALEVPLPGATLINVGTDTSFHRPMRVGHRLTYRERITDVSPAKETRLGLGHFVTTVTQVTDDEGLHVATHENVLFRFDPGTARADPAAVPPEPHPAGLDELPTVVMPVTLTRCVLDAAATRDFFPGHHDRGYARSQGARDVYLNTMFYHGLVDRIVTDWLGPDAWIARRRLRMVAPACVGDVLRSSGRVAGEHPNPTDASVEVALRLATEHGTVATARVWVDRRGRGHGR